MRSNDSARGLVYLSVFVLVAFLVWYAYQLITGHTGKGDFGLGGGNGDGDGSGKQDGKTGIIPGPSQSDGKSINPTQQEGTGKVPLPVRRPKPLPPAKQIINLPKLLNDLTHIPVVNKIIHPEKTAAAPVVHNLATQLAAANKDAGAFEIKPGTTATINKALEAVKKLPDTDFARVVAEWKTIDRFNSVLDTHLGAANITNGERSLFLTRLKTLQLL